MQLILRKNHLDSNPHPSRQEKNQKKKHWMLWDLNPQPLDLKDKTLAMSYKDSDEEHDYFYYTYRYKGIIGFCSAFWSLTFSF